MDSVWRVFVLPAQLGRSLICTPPPFVAQILPPVRNARQANGGEPAETRPERPPRYASGRPASWRKTRRRGGKGEGDDCREATAGGRMGGMKQSGANSPSLKGRGFYGFAPMLCCPTAIKLASFITGEVECTAPAYRTSTTSKVR